LRKGKGRGNEERDLAIPGVGVPKMGWERHESRGWEFEVVES
jgi:hypothetical protein